jgi:hypothetical protein
VILIRGFFPAQHSASVVGQLHSSECLCLILPAQHSAFVIGQPHSLERLCLILVRGIRLETVRTSFQRTSRPCDGAKAREIRTAKEGPEKGETRFPYMCVRPYNTAHKADRLSTLHVGHCKHCICKRHVSGYTWIGPCRVGSIAAWQHWTWCPIYAH